MTAERRTSDGTDVRSRIDEFLVEHGLTGTKVVPSKSGLLTTLGLLVLDGWVILLVYFLVSYPSGRLASRTDVLLVAPFVVVGGRSRANARLGPG